MSAVPPASLAAAGPSRPAEFPPAELERRASAYAVDRVLAWGVAGGIGYGVGRLVAPDTPWVIAAVAVGALLVIGLATAVLLGTTGLTPGKALAGLRVVRMTDGRPIGVGAALGRTTVLGLAGLPTLGLGVATLAWTAAMDPSGKRRARHDALGDAIVVDVRPRPVAEVEADERPQQIVNLTAMRLLPTPAAPSAAEATPARRSEDTPVPGSGPRSGAPASPQPSAPASVPAAGGWGAPAPGAPAPGAPAPGAPVAAPPAVAAPPSPAQPAAGGPRPPAQPPARQAPPTPSAPTSAPSAAPSSGQPVPGRRAARPGVRWRVTFDTGESFVVEGLALVGRRPEPRDGEPVRHVVPLRSEDMSLSKTHAQFQVVPDGTLVVMDRGSTNGSYVLRGGASKNLSPGRPATLLDGDQVRFGDRVMKVVKDG